MIALSIMDRTSIRKYNIVHQVVLTDLPQGRQTFAKTGFSPQCLFTLGDLHVEMKQLQLIPQAIVLTLVVSGAAGAETCFSPARRFVPNDSVAIAEFADLISQDFETYIHDVQAYFRCLDEERARAFEEAREVSQDYKRFLQDRGDGDR